MIRALCYPDVSVIVDLSKLFVFTEDARPSARARTLKAFIGLLATIPSGVIEGHLRRHDFSRWFDEVFRDRPLAAHLHDLERRVDRDSARAMAEAITQSIRARYETTTNAHLVERAGSR